MTDFTTPGKLDDQASHTDWSMIYQAARGEVRPAREAWERLARRYWPAIYAYIRRSGRDVQESADLTQGFVCDVLVDRGLIEAADRSRGRFRTLLLTALKNYLVERHRHASRLKRTPTGPDGDHPRVVGLGTDPRLLGEIATDATPEAAFSMQWSVSLVHRVLDRVRRACLDEALTAHWAVFERRVIRPMLHGDPPASYAVLVDQLDLRDAAQAANMMITVKRRFARALCDEVAQTLRDAEDIEDELADLMRTLEQAR